MKDPIEDSEARAHISIETASKSIALAAALLPGMGVIIRYFALLPIGAGPNAMKLAWSVPLAALIATGLSGALLGSGYLLFFFILRRAALGYHISYRVSALKDAQKKFGREFKALGERVRDAKEKSGEDEPALAEALEDLRRAQQRSKEMQADLEEMQADAAEVGSLFREQDRRLRSEAGRLTRWIPPFWALAMIFVLLQLAFVLFLPLWPIVIAGELALLIVRFFFVRAARRSPDLGLVDIWPAIVLVALILSISAGLAGYLPGTGHATYQFAAGTPLVEDGEAFLEVGTTDSVTYLFDCQDASILAVAQDSVEVIEFRSSRRSFLVRPPPNLWSVLFEHAEPRLGFTRYCP